MVSSDNKDATAYWRTDAVAESSQQASQAEAFLPRRNLKKADVDAGDAINAGKEDATTDSSPPKPSLDDADSKATGDAIDTAKATAKNVTAGAGPTGTKGATSGPTGVNNVTGAVNDTTKKAGGATAPVSNITDTAHNSIPSSVPNGKLPTVGTSLPTIIALAALVVFVVFVGMRFLKRRRTTGTYQQLP